MSDAADMFKKLTEGRLKSKPAETEIQPQTTSEPAKKNKFTAKTPEKSTPEDTSAEVKITTSESTKKRGRPATGKRSDPEWIGRTYYIRQETDFDVEDELIKLKRAGINLDKSELVDFLLAAWVKWRKGENIDIQISEITPRRKDELT
jgi:hypothetical protein